MLPVEEYDAIWSGIRDRAAAVVAEGERDLSRVVRRLEREWRDMSMEPKGGTAFGKVVVLPRAALIGGRRDVFMHVLLTACTPATSMVVELGSGWGHNLLNLHLWGGPRVPYYALEPAESGRACTDVLAALEPDLDLTTAPYDYERPDYGVLPAGNAHVLVFSVHSIEQVTDLPRETVTGLLGLGTRVTGVHFEPVGWQIVDEPDQASHEYALRQRYNRNLWPLLQELERAGDLTVETVTPDLFGDKYKNPGTLIVWHAPAG